MLALLTMIAAPAHADTVAARCFVHGATDRIHVDEWQACDGFTVKSADGRTVTSEAYDGSGSYIVGEDGRIVIFVADYATMTADDKGFTVDWRTREPGIGVRIYRDGVEVASHTVESLVSPAETTSSVSHLDWVDERTFEAPITDTWTLTTRTGRTIPFDIAG